MKIEFYGKIANSFDQPVDISLPEEGMSVSALRTRLANQFDVHDMRQSFIRAVVNDAFVSETHVVAPGDTMAFFSPVSGG